MLPRWVAFAAVFAVASSARAQSRQGTVDITVDVKPNAAHVEEQYLLAPPAGLFSLRVLTRPCVAIENLAFEQLERVLPVTESRAGPWVMFTSRDTIAAEVDSLRLLVRYDVRPAGASVIPLVHLASAVTNDGSTRTGPVKMLVRISDTAARVSFPHMTRQAPNEWSARYVAVPSFVEITGLQAPCDEGGGASSDNGGLVWRFFLLVGIMITWVPLYLAWARRSSDREHP